jgi:hypothetical protein
LTNYQVFHTRRLPGEEEAFSIRLLSAKYLGGGALPQANLRVREVMHQGTGSLEIKSGYGLTPEDELKMLRVIRRLKETTPLLKPLFFELMLYLRSIV